MNAIDFSGFSDLLSAAEIYRAANPLPRPGDAVSLTPPPLPTAPNWWYDKDLQAAVQASARAHFNAIEHQLANAAPEQLESLRAASHAAEIRVLSVF